MNLNALTLKEAASGLRGKKFSSVELTRACFDRVKAVDERLNAFVQVGEESAMASAAEVDAVLAKGECESVLAGIPVALKDIFNTDDGMPTTCASRMLRDFVAPYDATAVAKLRRAGAVFLGKTNMDEFACGASTEHSCYGVVKNPWDTERVAGGSSGGSAAAIAADMCLYSLGTDTGGSIRQPASLCGVSGLKVTYGRVSRFGVTAMASSWDTIGSFGKTVEDIAMVLRELAGFDPHDATTPAVAVPDYAALLTGDVKGLKIGVPREYFAEGVESEVADIVRASIAELKKAGAEVREISLPSTKYAVAVYYICMPAELSANLARFDSVRYGPLPSDHGSDLIEYYMNARAEGFGDEIKRRIMIGTYVLSAGYYDAYYRKAQRVRTRIIEDFDSAFSEVDVICGPVSPFPAFTIGEKANDPLAMYLADALTIPASAAGVPALSAPCGFTKSGLPVGLQIIGPQFEEGRILNVGHAYQQLTDWHIKKASLK